jgi:hypothetical protein
MHQYSKTNLIHFLFNLLRTKSLYMFGALLSHPQEMLQCFTVSRLYTSIESPFTWLGPSSTQRQARKLISGPSPTTKTRLLSLNRTQSSVVIGLLTGHNTLRRQLNLMRLINSPLYRKCGTEEGNSVYILCECKALTSLTHTYLSSFSLDPNDSKSPSLGAIWNFRKGTGFPWTTIRLWGSKGLFKAKVHRSRKSWNPKTNPI